jgi:hypothetical protein
MPALSMRILPNRPILRLISPSMCLTPLTLPPHSLAETAAVQQAKVLGPGKGTRNAEEVDSGRWHGMALEGVAGEEEAVEEEPLEEP